MLAAVVLPACGRASPVPTERQEVKSGERASLIPAEAQEVKVDGGSYWNVSPAQLKSMLKNKDFLLIHVHHKCEEEIPDTAFFVRNDEIEKNLSRFPEDKRTQIVAYCYTGSDSAPAARTLVSLGFTSVFNLDGGLAEWEKQGYELE